MTLLKSPCVLELNMWKIHHLFKRRPRPDWIRAIHQIVSTATVNAAKLVPIRDPGLHVKDIRCAEIISRTTRPPPDSQHEAQMILKWSAIIEKTSLGSWKPNQTMP